jgi:hypothetical protein
MSTTITSLDAIPAVVIAENGLDYSKPITEINQVKALLCRLINDASNAVNEAQVKAPLKAKALFELFTGSQTCGYVKDVCSLDSVEEMIVNTKKLVKASHYIPTNEPDVNVHIFELELPHNYEGYTDAATIAHTHACRLLQKVHTFFDPKSERVSHVCYEAPVITSLYHFVVVHKNGKTFMDRWEPGAYFPKVPVNMSRQKVQFGNPRIHGKREIFPILWGTLTACETVDQTTATPTV